MRESMKINGKAVHTPLAPVTIKVTAQHIQHGDRRGPSQCAAALACKNQIGNCTQARVHISTTYLLRGGKWYRYQTPPALKYELVAFDRGGRMRPGEYILRPKKVKTGSSVGRNKPRHLKKPRFKTHKLEGIRPRGANV